MASFRAPSAQAAWVMQQVQGREIKSVGSVRDYEQGLTRVAEWQQADDPPLPPVGALMSSNDVATVIAQVITRAVSLVSNSTVSNAVVAVVDPEGFVLGVWSLLPT